MKIHEITESVEINPKHRPFIQLGHQIRNALEPKSGVEWDDEEFNKAAQLTTNLIHIGASYGPKTPAEALKKAGYDIEEFKALVKKAQSAKPVAMADPETDDQEDDMDRAPSDDEIARKADRMARA